jgi:predicted RNase H-like HicB family nuclease
LRQVVIYPGEDGWWVVECPSLPGCVSQGRTKEEAAANIREAIDLYIDVLKERNEVVPEETFGALVMAV